MMVSRRNQLALRGGLPFLLVLLSGCSEPPPPPAPPPVPVTVITAQPQNVPRVLEVMAQTEGAKETEVRARVDGMLMKQFYQEGDRVKAGDPLFQIDRASYANAYAEAKARADQTARERVRYKKLMEMNGVSRKEYDDIVSADDMAKAALRQASLNLSWTNVTAPVDGITGRAEKSVGNLISMADNLLTVINQNDPIWVRFSLSESESAKLPDGRLTPEVITSVELILPNGSVYGHPGKLNFLASSIDTMLGTQQLRAEFPNPEGRLLPGQFVRARLTAGMYENIYLIPQAAIMQTAKGDIVMTADAENKVAPRPIKLGEWFGKDWIVLGGLNPGDKVIVDNLIKLRPGGQVAPHPPQAAPQSPQGAPQSPQAAPQAAPQTPQAAPQASQTEENTPSGQAPDEKPLIQGENSEQGEGVLLVAYPPTRKGWQPPSRYGQQSEPSPSGEAPDEKLQIQGQDKQPPAEQAPDAKLQVQGQDWQTLPEQGEGMLLVAYPAPRKGWQPPSVYRQGWRSSSGQAPDAKPRAEQ